MRAMLRCAGEAGFASVSVDRVCRVGEAAAREFYACFGSKEECFALAYEAEGERVRRRLGSLLLAGAGRGSLRAALFELHDAALRQPALARSMLLEVNAAGKLAAEKRLRLMDDLARLLDCALGRSEPRAAEPSTAAIFLVGAVSGIFARAIGGGELESLRPALADLVELAVVPFPRLVAAA